MYFVNNVQLVDGYFIFHKLTNCFLIIKKKLSKNRYHTNLGRETNQINLRFLVKLNIQYKHIIYTTNL